MRLGNDMKKTVVRIKISLLLAAAAGLAACKSVEGVYLPDCVAYAGDSIELRDGRFEWDKFSDEVIVGDNGEVVDQFPQYPLSGSYRVDAGAVEFSADNGTALPGMHLVTMENRLFLLTETQAKAWRERSEWPACALVLGGYPEH